MKKTIFILLTALLATSCMEECPQQALPSGDALVLSAQQVAVTSGTKAPVTGTTFPTSLGMVLAAYSSASSSTYFSGIPFSYSSGDGGWKASTAKYWPQSGTVDFFAYSCPGLSPTVTYQSNASAGVSSFVTGSNASAQADLMFGAASGCTYSSNSKPQLNFKHAMALVSFTVRCPDMNYSSGNGVTIESITMGNAYWGGTCSASRSGSNVNSISWSSLANQQNGVALQGTSSQGLTTTAAAYGNGFLLPPQTAVNFTINYKIWSGGSATSKSYTYTNSGSWAMATKNVYAIEITAGNDIVVMPGVEDWADMTKDWFYADGNVVTRVGNAFTLDSGQPVFWRESNSGAYELLNYVSGTYGSVVEFTGKYHNVTVTKIGSVYTVSYVTKPPSFGGLNIAPAPVYYNGSKNIITDSDWNHDSYGSVYADNNGSYYYRYLSSNVSYGGYNDWRLPTRDEWIKLTTGTRDGSTVNGNNGVKFAKIQLTGVTHAGNSTPLGLLLFPDGLTITGKALTNYINSTTTVTTGVTGSELQTYLDQGCAFIPASGCFYAGPYSGWQNGGSKGFYWSSTNAGDSNYRYLISFDSNDINWTSERTLYYYCSYRLVRTAD